MFLYYEALWARYRTYSNYQTIQLKFYTVDILTLYNKYFLHFCESDDIFEHFDLYQTFALKILLLIPLLSLL